MTYSVDNIRDLHFALMNLDPWTVEDQLALGGSEVAAYAREAAFLKQVVHAYVARAAADEAAAELSESIRPTVENLDALTDADDDPGCEPWVEAETSTYPQ